MNPAKELFDSLEYEKWSDWVTLPDGSQVRAKKEIDDSGESYFDRDEVGTIHWPERYDRGRPGECDGAARKLDTRDGPVWWQPPQDAKSDPTVMQWMEKRVRGWFYDDWCYVGVVVEVKHPPCPTCGECKRDTASLWGIESDAGEYFQEVINDLLSELGTTV